MSNKHRFYSNEIVKHDIPNKDFHLFYYELSPLENEPLSSRYL